MNKLGILAAATALASGGMGVAAPTSRIYVAHRGDYAQAMEATMPVLGPFADGDRVVFLGDSLTQGGRYHRIIADWYLTHFPERDIKFFDAGVGGDSAKYCAPRFASDVVRPKPTVVAVMFGSNDAGFRTLPEFTADMTNLSDRIARECGNPKTVWITSTPYDEYSVREPKGRKGYDAKMRVLEEAVRTTAEHAKGRS